jgi:pyridoxamine--pyruvate transaminase
MAVAVETSTGTLYPIERLGALARRYGALFMVDAISALVAADFRMDDWGVDVCFASPQKCISGPQGVAIVAVSPRAWKAVEDNPQANTSLCLDLSVWRRYHDVKVKAMNRAWREGGPAPHSTGRAPHEVSPSGPVVRGLHGALCDIFNEGLDHVRRRHHVCSAAVRAAARALGLRLVAVSEETAAPSVTVVYLPQGVNERDFRSYLLKETGVVVANGEIGDDNIRIGTMGWGAQKRFLMTTLQALEQALAHFGWQFSPGCGVAAGQAVFSSASDVDWDRVPRV